VRLRRRHGLLLSFVSLVACQSGTGAQSDAGLEDGGATGREAPPSASDPPPNDREPAPPSRDPSGGAGVCFICDRDYRCDGVAFGVPISNFRVHVTTASPVPGACGSRPDVDWDPRPVTMGGSHVGFPLAVEPCGATYFNDAGVGYAVEPTSTTSFRILLAAKEGADLSCNVAP